MINLKNSTFKSSPFPHLIFEEFFEKSFLENLLNEFMSEDLIRNIPNYAGGRWSLANSNLLFYEFLKKSKTWNVLYQHMNSKLFFEEIMCFFENETEQYGFQIDEDKVSFSSDYFYKQAMVGGNYFKIASKYVAHVSAKQLVSALTSKIKIKGFEEFRRIDRRLFNRNRVSLSIDFSAAKEGYTREIHRDSDGRIAAMVIYLDDFFESEGGEFVMHKYKNSENLSYEYFPPQPKEEDTEEFASYKPIKNSAIIFLSTPNSYHSVPMITKCNGWRKFIYAGFTSVDKPAWKTKFKFNYFKY